MLTNQLEKYRPVWAPDGDAAPSGGTDTGVSSSSSTGQSSPSASPAPSTPSTPSPAQAREGDGVKSGAGEAFDFGSMFGPDDTSDPIGSLAAPPADVTSAPPPPAAATEGLPGLPKAEPKAEAAAPAASPAAQAAPEQATPPTQQAAPAALDRFDPVQLGNYLAQNEPAALEMASQIFALSDSEKEALETDVIGTIPKLLARVFVKSQQNLLAQMGSMIPIMMQRQMEMMKRHTANEEKFYAAWPGIDRSKYHDSVMKYAAVYRQMHPQASLDQMIADLGPMIMMAHKIVPQMSGQVAGGRSPANPAHNAGANGRSPPPAPFVPAGAGPVSAAKPAQLEAWEAMFAHQNE